MIKKLKLTDDSDYFYLKRQVSILRNKLGRKIEKACLRKDEDGAPDDYVLFVPRLWYGDRYVVAINGLFFENPTDPLVYFDQCDGGWFDSCLGTPRYIMSDMNGRQKSLCDFHLRSEEVKALANYMSDFYFALRNVEDPVKHNYWTYPDIIQEENPDAPLWYRQTKYLAGPDVIECEGLDPRIRDFYTPNEPISFGSYGRRLQQYA